jgi:formylglycine-generating enzyme required for sulfatase activity
METSWPQSDAVFADSFMGRLRNRTGLAGFDLPTDAQWEYACRAGTTGALYDGTVNITNVYHDARLYALARYRYNGGFIGGEIGPDRDCTTANGTAAVGSYAPNAWGLYDMYGNVWEWCLDWYSTHLGTAAVEDPKGPLSPDGGANNLLRGASWAGSENGYQCRSAHRGGDTRYQRVDNYGFRLVRNLP